ncbi:MAG TPA: MBOAT family O-acyltransferase [Micropepsaceae bacterium]|nr:MBOAT family O-acyltransferase [Micropepsaceae bacterium]
MLFNSNIFIFAFLPIALSGFYVLGTRSRAAAALWLILCSFVFYAWWNPPFVLLLLASVSLNCAFGKAIAAYCLRPRRQSLILWFAVIVNLGVLFYFKYLYALLSFLQSLGIPAPAMDDVILPLGISFYTFTQLGYLLDCRQGLVKEQGTINYFLFVTFFPHLIVGPILHHREIMPQFAKAETYRCDPANLSVGLTMFVIGLSKKILLADPIADAANAGFADPQSLAFFASWGAALAYSLQLYFDFSGYSDMAVGLARMFGVWFPVNFNSPYKAASIIDYWQRWHMTLTHYLTEYLYNPVSMSVMRWRIARGYDVSRKAMASTGGIASLIALPTFFTMILAGIWHGAGFQFLVFGLLHACYLTINHAWRLRRHGRAKQAAPSWVRHAGSVLLTYLAALVAQVFFRASSAGSAVTLLSGMAGAHGAGAARPNEILIRIVVLFAIAWTMPNTQQILARFSPALTEAQPSAQRVLQWRPSFGYAAIVGCLFGISVLFLQSQSRFLYFQF